VFRAAEGLTWDLGETAGTVAVRMPAEDNLLDLIAEIGPLACTGAPPTGEGRANPIAVSIDDGVRDGPPSTIVDVTRATAQVLRSGAIPDDDVQQVADGMVSWGSRPAHDPADQEH
jgi:L-threonylcarbamoyladenylate synthase